MPKYLIIHHTGGTDAQPLADSSNYTVTQCDADHKVRFNMKSSLGFYVGYTYFIDKAGAVTQTRIDTEEGAHTKGYNSNSIGICLAGNFDATFPTEAQIKSLTKLLQEKTKQYSIPVSNIVPHRTFANKTCYGNKLANDWAQKLVGTPPIPTRTKEQIKQDIINLVNQL
jgi:N-acetyl-anhydromuramyl-L-alanine amidase AmpD